MKINIRRKSTLILHQLPYIGNIILVIMVKIIFEKNERDAMEKFKKLPELKKLIIKMKDSSYSAVRHELLNLASKHDHLSRYKFTNP